MATQATLAALAKLTGMRDGVLARTARADFAGAASVALVAMGLFLSPACR